MNTDESFNNNHNSKEKDNMNSNPFGALLNPNSVNQYKNKP